MKKMAFVVFVVFALLVTVACASVDDCGMLDDTTALGHAPSESTNNSLEVVLQTDKHFRIIQPADLPSWYLRYEVLNRYGAVVDYFVTSRPAWIEYVTESLLEVGWSAGIMTRVVRFYSIENDIFSEFFITPFFIKDEIIAEMRLHDDGDWILAVQNIFDSSTFYKEFSFRGLSFSADPFSHVVNIEYWGDDRIKITYWSDEDRAERYAIFDLLIE